MRRFLSPTLLRFLAVGGVAYVVNQALLVALFEGARLALLPASVLALEASILVRFGLNDRWTFRSRRGGPLWQRFYRFNLSSFGSPLIALAGVNLLTPALGVNYLVANSVGIALGLAWNWFWASRVVWVAAERVETVPLPLPPAQGTRAEAA